MRKNKMAESRMTVGGEGAFDSPLNSLFGQKISVRDGNFNQKSKNPFKNLAVILNLFQHLINKHRLMKGLCLLRSNEDGQMLKQERKFFIQSQSLTPARAFSVAEAMIALLIGSLILGYSAPMIAKQIKHNNISDVQVQVLSRKIEELRATQSNIPSGAVMYFDLPSCPNGWNPLSKKYPSSKNAFIRNIEEQVALWVV